MASELQERIDEFEFYDRKIWVGEPQAKVEKYAKLREAYETARTEGLDYTTGHAAQKVVAWAKENGVNLVDVEEVERRSTAHDLKYAGRSSFDHVDVGEYLPPDLVAGLQGIASRASHEYTKEHIGSMVKEHEIGQALGREVQDRIDSWFDPGAPARSDQHGLTKEAVNEAVGHEDRGLLRSLESVAYSTGHSKTMDAAGESKISSPVKDAVPGEDHSGKILYTSSTKILMREDNGDFMQFKRDSLLDAKNDLVKGQHVTIRHDYRVYGSMGVVDADHSKSDRHMEPKQKEIAMERGR